MITHRKADQSWITALKGARGILDRAVSLDSRAAALMGDYLVLESDIKHIYFDAPQLDTDLMSSPASQAKCWQSFKNHLIKVRLSSNEYSSVEAENFNSFQESVFETMRWLLKLAPPEIKQEFDSIKDKETPSVDI